MSNFNSGWLSDGTANKYIKTYFKGNVDINEGDLIVRGRNKITVWNHEIKADFTTISDLPPTSAGLTLITPFLSISYNATSQPYSFQNGSYIITSTGNFNNTTTGIDKLFDKNTATAYSCPANKYTSSTGATVSTFYTIQLLGVNISKFNFHINFI